MAHLYSLDGHKWREVSDVYPFPFLDPKNVRPSPTDRNKPLRRPDVTSRAVRHLGASDNNDFGQKGVVPSWHPDYVPEDEEEEEDPKEINMSQIVLRDYQEESIRRLYRYFEKNNGNPIVALPTGTGKSIVIGEFIRRACLEYDGTQMMMLTHVKELIEQNMRTLLKIWPSAPAGIYSAGIGRREHKPDIVFAGIQSVYKKPELFGHVDIVLIDECHLVSPRGTTMYRKFLDALAEVNPLIKVIGFSATPFRLGQGMLTDTGKGLFDDIAFDLTDRKSFNWLIQKGWLAPLIPKQTDAVLDVDEVKVRQGEYVLKDLQEAVDREEVSLAALREAVHLASDRKHWLVFASGIEHAEHVAAFLNDHYGVPATCVHSKISDEERKQRLKDFRKGKIQAMVNNNILTTGFDFPEIDCIIMLRPTQSPGLWVQMLGRGTRPAPGKENCLVLDFAGNTKRLGPINDPVIPRTKGKGAKGMAPVRLCDHCGCYSHASCRVCEHCNQEFPKNVKITSEADRRALIAGITREVNAYDVTKVVYRIHKKEGKPDSMRVDYYCGLRRYSEYICLDHGGYATRVAQQWWEQRSPWGVPPDVHAGMAAVDSLRVPKKIQVLEHKKYPEVCGYEFA